MTGDSNPSDPTGNSAGPLANDNPASSLSAVERGARLGIGPLSPLGMKVWHGESCPCVSCGELVRRADTRCCHCGQDLSLVMIEKMAAHSGPWYVHEHVRPFPGVSLDRLVRQVRRGVLTRTTIVRGPTTNHQWRFAAETPGLSKYLSVCWNCQAAVKPEDTYCKTCDVHLDRVPGELPDSPPPPPSPRVTAELEQLSQAVRTAAAPRPEGSAPSRLPAFVMIAAILIVAVAAVIAVVKVREQSRVERVAPPAVVVPVDASTTGVGG